MAAKQCIFCEIAEGKDPKSTVLFQNDKVVVFKDIRPAAPHHYLAIPREHIRDARSLKHQHIQLVEELLSAGKHVLEEQGGKTDEAKIGFHLPPLVFVQHLHLHFIAPASEMGFLSRLAYKDNSYWYHTVDYVLDRLRNMTPEDGATSQMPPEGDTSKSPPEGDTSKLPPEGDTSKS